MAQDRSEHRCAAVAAAGKNEAFRPKLKPGLLVLLSRATGKARPAA